MKRFSFLFLCISVFGGFWAQTGSCAEIPVIILDPGHGGSAVSGSRAARSDSSPNNASSPGGLLEKDLTLEFTLILKDEILTEASRRNPTTHILGVLLTREADINPDFTIRALTCNRSDVACMISIHFNAVEQGSAPASGSLTMIAAKAKSAREYEIDKAFAEGLAAACSAGVRQFLPNSKNKGVITDGHLHGGLGSNFFYQLNRQEHMKGKPKCFLEVEFLDNPTVEAGLLKGDRPSKFRVIARSIAMYLIDTVVPGTAKK